MSSKPLNILFLSHRFYPDVGGIESISEMLATAFSQAGHKVRLLTWSHDPSFKPFPFTVIRNPGKRQLFKEHYGADVVFENNPCIRLGWPRILFSRPAVIGLQTWLSPLDRRSSLNDNIKLAYLKRATKVVACSEAIRKKIWRQAIVIGNPYNEHTFKILPDLLRNKDYVFLGRLVSDKGADMAIEALHRILRNYDTTVSSSRKPSLTIVGAGPEKDRLEQLASNLDIKGQIRFVGQLRGDEIGKCLNEHKILLVPSRWEEPFGIVALEGIACGCLPIVSDGGGLPDAVGEAGTTFKSGDIDDLVKAIQRISDDPLLESKMRKAAEKHLAIHSSAHISKQYLSLIKSVVSKN